MKARRCSLFALERDTRTPRISVARSSKATAKSRSASRAFDDGAPIALAYDAAYYRFASPAPLVAPRRAFSFEEIEDDELSREEFEERIAEKDEEEEEEEEARQEREEERKDDEEEEEDDERPAIAGFRSASASAPDAPEFVTRLMERSRQQEIERALESSDEPPEAPPPASHKIFDDIAAHMAQATTYDVGKVNVDALFRELDRNLEKKPKKRSVPAAAPARTSSRDADLEEDLDLMAIAAVANPSVIDAPQLPLERSGPRWVDRFSESRELTDLDSAFRGNVARFTGALADAGARVRVLRTRVPAERAYLMHWAWRVGHDHDAQDVPPMHGVAIDWWHGDPGTSQAAALLMVDGFGIADAKAAPPLTSRHSNSRAADIVIAWDGELAVRAADGSMQTIAGTPRDENNSELIELARTYDVVRGTSAGHAAHFSSDGA